VQVGCKASAQVCYGDLAANVLLLQRNRARR
jgi:hypothetical protein